MKLCVKGGGDESVHGNYEALGKRKWQWESAKVCWGGVDI